MSWEAQLTDIVARLRQGVNVQAVYQGIVLPLGWDIANGFRPARTELQVINCKQIHSVIANGSEPAIDDQKLKQIVYLLELKCRGVRF